MPKGMNLNRAISLGKLGPGDWVNPNSLYWGRRPKLTLTQEQTGYLSEQVLAREDLRWFYAVIDDKPCIISEPSKLKVTLRGKTGYERGTDAIKQVCSLNSCEIYGCELKARPLDKRDIEELLPSKLIYTCRLTQDRKDAWLGNDFADEDGCGVYYICQDKVKKAHLYNLEDEYNISMISMSTRSVIELPRSKDIMVNMAAYKKYGVWCLK